MEVMAMRRPRGNKQEQAAIAGAHPGEEIRYFRRDPADYMQHHANCTATLNPDVDLVLLPRERSVPSLAMERGFRHVTLTPDGLMMLVGLEPEFVPYRAGMTMAAALAQHREEEKQELRALNEAIRDLGHSYQPHHRTIEALDRLRRVLER